MNIFISTKLSRNTRLMKCGPSQGSAVAPFLVCHLVCLKDLPEGGAGQGVEGVSLVSVPSLHPGVSWLLCEELHSFFKRSAKTEAMLSFSFFWVFCPGFVSVFVWRDWGRVVRLFFSV